jgi:hypothetical protein
MATNQTNNQVNIDQIGTSVSTMDANRAAELGNSQKMQTVLNNALVKEQARLTAKYGQNDPRVQSLATRISYNPNINTVYSQEINRLKVFSPAFDLTTWRITGCVYDSTGNPLNNVTVFLTTNGTSALEGVPYSCTGTNGAYTITLTSDFVAKLANANLQLGVSDSNKKVLAVSKDTFVPAAGIIINYFIYIPSTQCATPPVP